MIDNTAHIFAVTTDPKPDKSLLFSSEQYFAIQTNIPHRGNANQPMFFYSGGVDMVVDSFVKTYYGLIRKQDPKIRLQDIEINYKFTAPWDIKVKEHKTYKVIRLEDASWQDEVVECTRLALQNAEYLEDVVQRIFPEDERPCSQKTKPQKKGPILPLDRGGLLDFLKEK
jgi:hypothetical protein